MELCLSLGSLPAGCCRAPGLSHNCKRHHWLGAYPLHTHRPTTHIYLPYGSCLPYPPDAVGHDPGTEPQQWRRAQSSKRTEPQRPSSGNIPQRYTNGCLPTFSPLLDNNYYHYHYYLILPLPASPCRAHTYDTVLSLRPGEDYHAPCRSPLNAAYPAHFSLSESSPLESSTRLMLLERGLGLTWRILGLTWLFPCRLALLGLTWRILGRTWLFPCH